MSDELERLKLEVELLKKQQWANRKELGRLQEEVDELRSALNTVKYRIEQCGVWNGQGFDLTGMHPNRQRKVLEFIEDVLK